MAQPRPFPRLPALLALGLLASGVLSVRPVTAQDEELPPQVASLRGVTAVYVEAAADSELASLDLTSKDLQGRVGIRLFQGGVRILSEAEYLNDPEAPLVFVNLSMVRPSGTRVVYYLSIALLQGTSLLRDPGFQIAATTWRTDELGLLPASGKVGLLEIVDGKTQELVNDLATANPTD